MLGTATAVGQDVADFYANRQITILVGAGPGGITDTSARIIGDYLEELVPGGPSVIVQNMPGGGSVTMANHIYRSAARDGTVLGYSLPAVIVAQLMEPTRARYDGLELSWIGSAITSTNVISVLAGSPATTVDEALEAEIILGATGRGSLLYQLPTMARELLGLEIRIITGYQGSAEISLAMERARSTARPRAWITGRSPDRSGSRTSGFATWSASAHRIPGAGHAPSGRPGFDGPGEGPCRDPRNRPEHGGGPLFALRSLPAERLAALRTAFGEMLEDEAFSEAILASMRAPVTPKRGAELQMIVENALDTPESVVAEAKELLGL